MSEYRHPAMVITVAIAIYVEPLVTQHLNTPSAYISLLVHGLPYHLGGLAGVLLAAVSEVIYLAIVKLRSRLIPYKMYNFMYMNQIISIMFDKKKQTLSNTFRGVIPLKRNKVRMQQTTVRASLSLVTL